MAVKGAKAQFQCKCFPVWFTVQTGAWLKEDKAIIAAALEGKDDGRICFLHVQKHRSSLYLVSATPSTPLEVRFASSTVVLPGVTVCSVVKLSLTTNDL